MEISPDVNFKILTTKESRPKGEIS